MASLLGLAGVENVARVTFYQGNGANITPAMWLEVNGQKYAMAQYSGTFAVNEIPRATCMMSTGVLFDDQNNGLASGDTLASTETGVGFENAKAKVYLNLDGSMWDPVLRARWGGGDKAIFEGYVVGVSYHRVEGKIQLAVELVSQLVDLTFGTIFSKDLHPGSALDFTNTAAMDIAALGCAGVAGAGGTPRPAWGIDSLFSTGAPAFSGKSALNCPGADHAAGTLLGILECCAKMNLFKISCPLPVDGSGQNDAALAVLTSLIQATGAWLPGVLDTQPYKRAIINYLTGSMNQFKGTTFWDMLIQKWCPAFQFSFIPLPGLDGGRQGNSFGMVVPAWPTYKTPFKTLYLNDYVDFELRTQQHKPLSAVGVIAPWQSITGAVPTNPKGGGQGGARLCLGGIAGDPAKPKGQFLSIDAPGWAQSVIQGVPGASRLGTVNTAAHPNPGSGQRQTNFDRQKVQTSKLLDGYANAFLTSNYFRGRQGRFSSKLRFDISPGSILCLKADRNPLGNWNVNIGGVSVGTGGSSSPVKSLPEDIYGHVSRVTYNINADAPMAKTSFDLSAVRNEKENAGDYAVSSHPFVVNCPWNGCELVKGWGF
jgi:hypothetical protein